MKLNHKGTKTIKLNNMIEVEIELDAYKKMKCYIDLCDKEVGWLATAYKEGNVIRIKDAFLFDQEVHATTCELTPGGIADFVTNLYMTMDADEAMEISNNLTCWGHSHVNMSVTPSGQDDIQLRSFSTSGHDWFLRVIGNKRGEFEYTYIDYNSGIEIRDLDWSIIIPGLDMEDMKAGIEEEMKVKVRAKKYEMPNWNRLGKNTTTPYTPYGGYFNSSKVTPKSYIANNQGYSLLDDDFFNEYIKGEKSKLKEKDAEDVLADMGASTNHDLIMDIVGNNSDLVTDMEYQILDEALCQLTLDDLAWLSACNLEVAVSYLKDTTTDYFTDSEIEELHAICVYYKKNIDKLNHIQ